MGCTLHVMEHSKKIKNSSKKKKEKLKDVSVDAGDLTEANNYFNFKSNKILRAMKYFFQDILSFIGKIFKLGTQLKKLPLLTCSSKIVFPSYPYNVWLRVTSFPLDSDPRKEKTFLFILTPLMINGITVHYHLKSDQQ